jgi:hypothetical protein
MFAPTSFWGLTKSVNVTYYMADISPVTKTNRHEHHPKKQLMQHDDFCEVSHMTWDSRLESSPYLPTVALMVMWSSRLELLRTST